jgi:hypothetical protein
MNQYGGMAGKLSPGFLIFQCEGQKEYENKQKIQPKRQTRCRSLFDVRGDETPLQK